MKKKNVIMLGIILVSAFVISLSVSYAYFSSSLRDTRDDKDNGNANIKTCSIAEATTISNIPNSIGGFTSTDIYPGHKEVASFSVSARGKKGSSSNFQFVYNVLENGLGNGNVKVSVYKSKTPIETTVNHFACQKVSEVVGTTARFYETCEEKNLGTLIQETILTGEEERVVIGKDTIVVSEDNQDKTRYYYVVIEFLNKEEQNDYQNSSLRGKIEVEASAESISYQEEILNGTDPVLKDELIPVIIENNGVVRKANVADEWYHYENQE